MSVKWTQDISKLNKMELIKLKKDGLDILKDIEKYAETGFEAITPEDLDLLKWAGVYVQKPKTAGFFMLRVKLPGGKINAQQLHTLAGIARDYGRNLIDITTRQALQFHWIRIENLPDIFTRLAEVDLTATEACGDCPRTILGNPLAGVDPNEVMDTNPLVEELYSYFQNNRDFSNLPRKFKISISGSKYNPAHGEINDIAFTPAVKEIANEEQIGFHVVVGGGLAAQPHLATPLDIFVLPEKVLPVAIGVATIFRDHGYREKRTHARLKFLVKDWGAAKFKEELLKITGTLPEAGKDLTLGWNGGYFYGAHQQSQAGLNYVGLSIPVGRLNTEELEALAVLAEEYGDGSIRTCNSKNIVFTNIPDEKLKDLLAEKLLRKFTPFPTLFEGYTIPCTGNEFCNLALVETKNRAKALSEYLDQKVSLNTPVRIHLNGCPNSCGHQPIADLGIRGCLTRKDDFVQEAFEFFIGGILGPEAAFATKLNGKVPEKSLETFVEHLLNYFKAKKEQQETFNQFTRRVGISSFQDILDKFLEANSK